MLLPHEDHLLDGHILRLREEEGDEDGHDDHPRREQVEEAKLQVAERGHERLCHHEGEEHVDGDSDGLAGRTDLEGEDLAGHQPPERSP